MRSLLCVSFYSLREIDSGDWMVVVFLEHMPSITRAYIVVVVSYIIRFTEGSTGAIGEEERKVAERLGERGIEKRIMLGIFGRRRRGQWWQKNWRIRSSGRRRRRHRRRVHRGLEDEKGHDGR